MSGDVRLVDASGRPLALGTFTSAEGFGASPSASGTANLAAIQSALNVGGVVSLMTPGTYLITGASLVIRSNTLFWIGPGVIIKQSNAAGQARQVLVNYQYTQWAAGTSTAGPLTISAGNMTSSAKVVTVVFDQAHGLAVGDWVSIWNVSTAGYAGIHQVTGVTNSTTITFTAQNTPAASPAVVTTHAGYTMAGSKCDVNISVMGGGILDFDQANNGSAPSSSPRTFCTTFANVYSLFVQNVEARNAIKYNWNFQGIRSARIRDIRANGPSDGVHFTGNILDTLLSGASGLTSDNFIAAGTADFSTYQIVMGPVKGLTIENIGLEENKGIRFIGEVDNTMEDSVVRNVWGTTTGTQAAVQLFDDSGVQGGIFTYKNILLENISVNTGTASLVSAQGATGSTLYVRNCRAPVSTMSSIVTANSGSSGTTRHARIVVDSCRLDPSANAMAMLNLNNSTVTVDEAVVDNCEIYSASASFGRLIDNTAGTLTAATISNCRMVSGSSMIAVGVATGPAFLRFQNNYIVSTSYGISFSASSASTLTITIQASGNFFNVAQGVYRDATTTGTYKIAVRSDGTNEYNGKPFQRTAAQNFIVNGYDIQFDPLSTAATGGSAGNIVISTTVGSFLYSTRAGAVNQGPCIYTSSLGSWVAVGTGAAGVNTIIT